MCLLYDVIFARAHSLLETSLVMNKCPEWSEAVMRNGSLVQDINKQCSSRTPIPPRADALYHCTTIKWVD